MYIVPHESSDSLLSLGELEEEYQPGYQGPPKKHSTICASRSVPPLGKHHLHLPVSPRLLRPLMTRTPGSYI